MYARIRWATSYRLQSGGVAFYTVDMDDDAPAIRAWLVKAPALQLESIGKVGLGKSTVWRHRAPLPFDFRRAALPPFQTCIRYTLKQSYTMFI